MHRDIVVIGGSAGSIPHLVKVLGALPKDFAAAIFVAVHLRGRERSVLSEVLDRAGRVPAVPVGDLERIETGKIYVAVPDHRMLIAEGHVHLSRGPKEGLHRPSINVTFRSAAAAYRDRVIGVLLSGMLDDGCSGLWDIAHNHGITIVQDPEEAQFPSMLNNALEDVPINFKLKAGEIGPKLIELVNSDLAAQEVESVMNEVSRETFSGFTCPECRGPLYEHRAKPREFRCRVGHVFPLATLIEEATATQERKMYEAIVSVQEGADMAELAARDLGDGRRKELLAEARQLRKHAEILKQLIEERYDPTVFE